MKRGWPFRYPPNIPFRLNQNSPQAAGLTAWWPPLGSSSSALWIDFTSRGNRNGTPTGSPTFSAGGPVVGAHFVTSVNNFYSTNYDGVLGTAARTICVWFNTTQSSFGSMVSYGSSSGADTGGVIRFAIRGNTDGALVLNLYGGATAAWGSGFNDGVWHHAAIVIPGSSTTSDVIGYIDGVSYGTGSSDTTAIDTGGTLTPVWLGGDVLSGFNFDFIGSLGDVRMYSRPVPAAEIWQMYDPATRWELYEPVVPIFVVAKPPAGGVTGSLTATLADVTGSSTGGVAVEGTSTSTLADTSVSSDGSVSVSGATNTTLDNITSSSSGVLDITGVTNTTLADVSLTAVVLVAIVGTTAQTLADVTLTANNLTAATGTGAVTGPADTGSIIGAKNTGLIYGSISTGTVKGE